MSWPPHTTEQRSWTTAADNRDTSGRRPPVEDRLLAEITVSIPPSIADLGPEFSADTRQALDAATIAAARLDVLGGPHLAALSGFLLRSESVASSRIERVNPGLSDAAKAFAGLEASRDAMLVAAAAKSVDSLITAAPGDLRAAILGAHQLLLGDDPLEANSARNLRVVQNWIGGSDFTPRRATYVPPPADRVSGLLDDLVAFAQREDFGAVAQAAIVHVQFESIHPFTDGNGRIGRALINTVFRHRGLTSQVVVPVASVMLSDTDLYFEQITAYRTGDVDRFVRYLALGVVVAAEAAAESASTLAALPEYWQQIATPRAGSTANILIQQLVEHPVVTSSLAMGLVASSSRRAVFSALDQLETAGVLTEVTGGTRQRIWIAQDVLDELDRLTLRVGRRQPPTL